MMDPAAPNPYLNPNLTLTLKLKCAHIASEMDILGKNERSNGFS